VKPLSLKTVVRLSLLELVADRAKPWKFLLMSESDFGSDEADETDSGYPEETDEADEDEDGGTSRTRLAEDVRVMVCTSGIGATGGGGGGIGPFRMGLVWYMPGCSATMYVVVMLC